jgi:hypothetical protein
MKHINIKKKKCLNTLTTPYNSLPFRYWGGGVNLQGGNELHGVVNL